MLLIIVITIVVLVLLSLGIALIILKIKDLSNENTHFTTLSPEQGKLIVKEGKIVDVLSNMEGVYYDEKGEKIEKENPKKYGSLFKEFGVVFFGISPINKIYTFSVSWSEYVEKEAKKIKEERAAL